MSVCFVDSILPAQSNQAGAINILPRDVSSEGGALPNVYGVEAGIGHTADNASYCRGVQPITIEPVVDCESDSNDVEPVDVESSSNSAVVQQNTSDVAARSGASDVTRPAMRVVYCGTVSGDQLLEQTALGGLTQNIIGTGNSSAPASSAHTLESRSRNLSDPFSIGHTPSNVGDASAGNTGRMEVAVQHHNAGRSTAGRGKQQPSSGSRAAKVSSSDTGSSAGRKSTSKSRRAQSLDGQSVAVRQRCACVILLYNYYSPSAVSMAPGYKAKV